MMFIFLASDSFAALIYLAIKSVLANNDKMQATNESFLPLELHVILLSYLSPNLTHKTNPNLSLINISCFDY